MCTDINVYNYRVVVMFKKCNAFNGGIIVCSVQYVWMCVDLVTENQWLAKLEFRRKNSEKWNGQRRSTRDGYGVTHINYAVENELKLKSIVLVSANA